MKLIGQLNDLWEYLQSEVLYTNLLAVVGPTMPVRHPSPESVEWLGYRLEREGHRLVAYVNGVERNLSINVGSDTGYGPRGIEIRVHSDRDKGFIRQIVLHHLNERFPETDSQEYLHIAPFSRKVTKVVTKLRNRYHIHWDEWKDEFHAWVLTALSDHALEFLLDEDVYKALKEQTSNLLFPYESANTIKLSAYNVVADNLEVVVQAYEDNPRLLAHWLQMINGKTASQIANPNQQDEIVPLRSIRQMESNVRRSKGLDRVRWDQFLNPIEVEVADFPLEVRRAVRELFQQCRAEPSKTVLKEAIRLFGNTSARAEARAEFGNPGRQPMITLCQPMLRSLFEESDTSTLGLTQKELALAARDVTCYLWAARDRSDIDIPIRRTFPDYLADAKEFFMSIRREMHEETCAIADHGREEVSCWTTPIPAFIDDGLKISPLPNKCRVWAATSSPWILRTDLKNLYEISTSNGRQIAVYGQHLDDWHFRRFDTKWSSMFGEYLQDSIKFSFPRRLSDLLDKANNSRARGFIPEFREYATLDPRAHCIYCGDLLVAGCNCRENMRFLSYEWGIDAILDQDSILKV